MDQYTLNQHTLHRGEIHAGPIHVSHGGEQHTLDQYTPRVVGAGQYTLNEYTLHTGRVASVLNIGQHWQMLKPGFAPWGEAIHAEPIHVSQGREGNTLG